MSNILPGKLNALCLPFSKPTKHPKVRHLAPTAALALLDKARHSELFPSNCQESLQGELSQFSSYHCCCWRCYCCLLFVVCCRCRCRCRKHSRRCFSDAKRVGVVIGDDTGCDSARKRCLTRAWFQILGRLFVTPSKDEWESWGRRPKGGSSQIDLSSSNSLIFKIFARLEIFVTQAFIGWAQQYESARVSHNLYKLSSSTFVCCFLSFLVVILNLFTNTNTSNDQRQRHQHEKAENVVEEAQLRRWRASKNCRRGERKRRCDKASFKPGKWIDA